MQDLLKQVLANQYEASFCALAVCADRCPDSLWDSPVVKYPFCQVLLHTLFFADYYLGDAESFKQQAFHLNNADIFADYEQLADREPTEVYSKDQIAKYGDFCRSKAATTIESETEQSLRDPAPFERLDFSRAELHVYNIRHIQHHAAQLTLRLRAQPGIDVPWIGTGWNESAFNSLS